MGFLALIPVNSEFVNPAILDWLTLTAQTPTGWSAGTYHISDHKLGSSSDICVIDDTATTTNTTNLSSSSTFKAKYATQNINGSQIISDWILVRKYTANEPTITAQ